MSNYRCTITRVGINPAGGTAIVLTDMDGHFSTRWFNLPPDGRKEMLAASLTALASSLPVHIDIDPSKLTSPEWPTVDWLEVGRD